MPRSSPAAASSTALSAESAELDDSTRKRRTALVALAVVHLVMAPFTLPFRALGMDHFNELMERADPSIPSDESVAQRTLIVLNPPVDPFAAYFQVYRQVAAKPRPRRMYYLATGVSDIAITRVDAQTLRVRPTGGFLSSSTQWMLRDPEEPFALGTRVELSDATFTVSALSPKGLPAELTVELTHALEDRSFTWLEWGEHGYVPFTPPKVGESVVIPKVDLWRALFEKP